MGGNSRNAVDRRSRRKSEKDARGAKENAKRLARLREIEQEQHRAAAQEA